MILNLDIPMAARVNTQLILRCNIAVKMKRRLSFWEVWSAEVKKHNYFPDGNTTLPYNSIIELRFVNLITLRR